MKHLKQIMLFTTLAGVLALATQAVVFADKSQQVTYLEQNWTEKDREYFYFADQGSRLIPYDYFLHLEQADSIKLFRRDANMKRIGLIPALKSKNNPDALPIGLTRNGDHMGPTCAACHTQQITYQNETIHIDGGQAFFHLNQFLMDLTASLKATLDNPEKFDRFQQRLLGERGSDKEKEALKEGLQASYKKRSEHMLR
ncbi:MAG: di-heme-cytochrome C peroxidase, partial [Methylophilaceae bacterium]